MYDNNHQQSSVLIAVEHIVIYYSTLNIRYTAQKTLRSIASCFARIRSRCESRSIRISRHSLASNASRSMASYTIWILGQEKLLVGLASDLDRESSTCMARA